ncbi:MAG: sulfur carrier protein ThiS [Methanobacterium sp. PtaB.Bin024]|jgi:sulfur carrier protein|nr:MAG: sulfur carrier protein ThiS [Methanobacterium sp. PtaB.Bin024]
MEVTVIIGEDEKKLDVDEGKTVRNLLQMIEIPVETVVVKKNKAIIIEEEPLEDGDIIEVIRVIYGG